MRRNDMNTLRQQNPSAPMKQELPLVRRCAEKMGTCAKDLGQVQHGFHLGHRHTDRDRVKDPDTYPRTHTQTFTRTECRHMIANERDRQSKRFEQQGDRQHRRREAA